MNGLPEHDPEFAATTPDDSEERTETVASDSEPAMEWVPAVSNEMAPADEAVNAFPSEGNPEGLSAPYGGEEPLFQSWSRPEIRPPVRIPHLGHLAVLLVFAIFGLLCATVLIRTALHYHWYGITSPQAAMTDIHYTLGSEALLYLVTFGLCLLFFPMIWHKSFFAGVQWNGGVALHLRKRLFVIASVCFGLALVNGIASSRPQRRAYRQDFRAPGAAWMLFDFVVTFAPFFEEMVFRGFLLPSLCTAFDWIHEKASDAPVRPLDENGQPRWSMTSMVIASIFTSLPFAGMHAAQTGYSWGPFILLVGVSLVLCWARLSTRSLAASVMVHASYNFLLFSLMMLGTGGFKHLDKM